MRLEDHNAYHLATHLIDPVFTKGVAFSCLQDGYSSAGMHVTCKLAQRFIA